MTQQQIAYWNMQANQKQAEAAMRNARTQESLAAHKITTEFPTEVGTGIVSTASGIIALALM